MERRKFDIILSKMNQICMEINAENDSKNPDNQVVYEVLQLSDLRNDWDIIHRITMFYNENWTGNRDFMHIPNIMQVLNNCRNYPIILAREKGKKEIIGISTIKYSENNENSQDPYFPEQDTSFFSITGILTKKDNRIKGIGKKIYEIAVRGSYEYEKEYPGTRLMCVIDCRNKHSLEALAVAIENINNNSNLEFRNKLPANIMAYYELKEKKKDELLEAPTLVLEVGLNPDEKIDENQEEEEINYFKEEDKSLFESLVKQLRSKLRKYGIQEPHVGIDLDDGNPIQVYFYPLSNIRGCNIRNIRINPGDTSDGNCRTPEDESTISGFVGPMPKIYDAGESR